MILQLVVSKGREFTKRPEPSPTPRVRPIRLTYTTKEYRQAKVLATQCETKGVAKSNRIKTPHITITPATQWEGKKKHEKGHGID